jgi:hypothetical protein
MCSGGKGKYRVPGSRHMYRTSVYNGIVEGEGILGRNKYLRITLSIIMSFLFASTACRNAYADSIWTDDVFYRAHLDDCIEERCTYSANGSEGYVGVLKEPYSDNTIDRIENGKTIYVAATYEDENGDVWGYAENEDIIGWFRMSELQLVYDHDAFRKEHESELEYFDRKLYNDLLDSLFTVWSYPGSDK